MSERRCSNSLSLDVLVHMENRLCEYGMLLLVKKRGKHQVPLPVDREKPKSTTMTKAKEVNHSFRLSEWKHGEKKGWQSYSVFHVQFKLVFLYSIGRRQSLSPPCSAEGKHEYFICGRHAMDIPATKISRMIFPGRYCFKH